MDGFESRTSGGSLHISVDVVEKIARLATLEIEGVHSVAPAQGMPQRLLGKLGQPKAIAVDMNNDVADITVSMVVNYGVKISELSEKVQQGVKDSVQSMTSITVARVDVIVVGIAPSGDE